MSNTIVFGSASDVGAVREDNQDCLGKFPEDGLDFSVPPGLLFVVADGMGGHKGGSVASQLAVKVIGETYLSEHAEGSTADKLRKAVDAANTYVYEYAIDHPNLIGMGTTCVVLALAGDEACCAHIGDSRLYRVSNRKILQLTQDHSRVADMERQGMLTKEEARLHPERSQLYRALGIRPEMEVDIKENLEPRPGEFFVLCTDGLSNMVEDEEIKDIVLKHSPHEACDVLVELANQRGGYDNITVQVIQIEGSESFLAKLKNSIG